MKTLFKVFILVAWFLTIHIAEAETTSPAFKAKDSGDSKAEGLAVLHLTYSPEEASNWKTYLRTNHQDASPIFETEIVKDTRSGPQVVLDVLIPKVRQLEIERAISEYQKFTPFDHHASIKTDNFIRFLVNHKNTGPEHFLLVKMSVDDLSENTSKKKLLDMLYHQVVNQNASNQDVTIWKRYGSRSSGKDFWFHSQISLAGELHTDHPFIKSPWLSRLNTSSNKPSVRPRKEARSTRHRRVQSHNRIVARTH